MRIQFPIQLIVTQTIHRSQKLTFDCLTFHIIDVTKLGLTYTTLLRVCSKEDFYLLFPLLNKTFQVDHFVQEEMFQLRTNKCTIQICYCFFKILLFKKFNRTIS
jgi:hypothetical protein